MNDETEPNARPAGLPRGFKSEPDGIHYNVPGKGEGGQPDEWRWLCSPIRVLARNRDTQSDNWGRLIAIRDGAGVVKEWALPATMLAGDGLELRQGCMRMGLTISTAQGAKAKFLELLTNWRPKKLAVVTDRLGWTDAACRAFVLGDGTVIGGGFIVFQHTGAGDQLVAEMRPNGAVEDWRVGVASRCIGNPLLIFSASIALAGPFLEPLGIESGGFHLRGASSKGKTSAQKVAASVWGSPASMGSWRTTDNSLEGTASVFNSTCLVLDEIGQVAPRAAQSIAYMLGNGKGKGRADRSGLPRSVTSWRLLFLSSGEVSLAQKVAEDGLRTHAGQEVRFLDIGATGQTFGLFDDLHGFDDPGVFANEVGKACALSYGTAGPAIVSALLVDMDANAAAVRAAAGRWALMVREEQGDELDAQAGRALDRFGLVAAAGEFATRAGITGWPEGAAFNAASVAFRLWKKGHGKGLHEDTQAIERVRDFILRHGQSRFTSIEFPDGVMIRDSAGWRDNGAFYFHRSGWAEVHAGADPIQAAKALKAAGFLRTGGGKDLTIRPSAAADPDRPRVYAVLRTVLGEGGDA